MLLGMAITLTWSGLAGFLLRASPQDWQVRTWETEDGLPENSATTMVQTEDGYLWFGTFNGLVRFDGAQFKVFEPGNTPALPGDAIIQLHLDRKGRMWIATLQGLAVREGDSWSRYPPEVGGPSATVRTISERPNGDLLFTLFDGSLLEFVDGRFQSLLSPPGAAREGYLGVVDSQGHWWVAQSRFIGWWDGKAWHEAPELGPLPLAGSNAIGCAQGRDGCHWILNGRHLTRFRGLEIVEHRELAELPGGFWSMTEDRHGRLWIATFDRGACEVAPSGELRRWSAPETIRYNGTRFVFEDREENLWIGTSGGGLSRLKRRRVAAFGRDEGLTERVVKSVAVRPDGSLWVGTYGKGLFELSESGARPVTWEGCPNGPLYIQSVLSDRSGRTWIGTYKQGFWVSEGSTFRIVDPAFTAGGNVIALFEDSRGRIWLSGGDGVACHDAGIFRVFGPKDGLPLAGVRCFAEDSEGSIWVSNLEGVFRLKADRFGEILDLEGKSFRQITSLKGDADGVLWMGSLNDGIFRRTESRILHVGPEEGLPVGSIHAFLEDAEHVWWLPSNRGIVRVARTAIEARARGETKELPCQLLDLNDGLPSIECSRGNQPICAQDRNGRLWYATLRGVARLVPSDIELNRLPTHTCIEELVYEAGPDSGPGSLTTGGTGGPVHLLGPFPGVVHLPAGSRRIEVHYTSPSFSSPEKVRFQVMWEGQDSNWRNMGTRRVAYFEGLKPGTHTFRVRGSNDDGVWDEAGARVLVDLPPRFWQTVWFQGLLGTALVLEAGLIGGLVLVHRRRRRAEGEVQRQRTELAHFSRVVTVGELTTSLAHELNHPQSAILSNAQAGEMFLSAQPPALDEVRKIFADIVRDNRRANEILQRLRAFLKKRDLEFEPVDVPPLLRDIATLVASDARARQVTLELEPASPLPRVHADRVHLQQVLLNLVLNALDAMAQNGDAPKRIQLGARHSDPDTIEVSVRDTGPGIPQEKLSKIFDAFYSTKPQGMGMGLAIARRLLEAHGGRIWASNHPEGGAVIRFTLHVLHEAP